MRIRICHLITDLELGGGAERTLVNLVTGLDRSQFENDVVSLMEPGALARPLADAGIKVTGLGMRQGLPNPASLVALVRHLQHTRPTILQTWLYHADLAGTLAAWLARPPHLVWNLRCSDTTQASGEWSTRQIMRVLAVLSRRPDAIIVNSRKGRLFHEQLGYHPRQWVDIPNGVDLQRFRQRPAERARLRAELSLTAGTLTIGLVARFHPMKDCTTFLQAAAAFSKAHTEARFILCGYNLDSVNEELRKLITELQLNERVILLGRQSDIQNVYPMFDISVLSSGYGEGFPNVLIEAMACGVPCVATDVGDSREIIGQVGVVVPPRDPQALAYGFETILSRGPESVGEAARAHVMAHYGIDAMRLRYAKLYEALASD